MRLSLFSLMGRTWPYPAVHRLMPGISWPNPEFGYELLGSSPPIFGHEGIALNGKWLFVGLVALPLPSCVSGKCCSWHTMMLFLGQSFWVARHVRVFRRVERNNQQMACCLNGRYQARQWSCSSHGFSRHIGQDNCYSPLLVGPNPDPETVGRHNSPLPDMLLLYPIASNAVDPE